MKHSLVHSIWVTAVALALPIQTAAAEFAVPDWAGDENARFSQWLNFTSVLGDPGNAPDVGGSNAGGRLTQSVPGAIITGSGNIYNPAAASSFLLANESDAPYKTVVLQTKIIGSINADSVALEYEENGQTKSLAAPAVEIARESGGFGDTVITQWTWDISQFALSRISIRFDAAGSHASLAAVRLDVLLEAERGGELIEAGFEEPSNDRWNYPHNASPGARARASLFRATDESGVSRYGTFIVGFDTAALIPKGKASYQIITAQLQLMTSDNFEVPYDPTYDPGASHLPDDHEAHITDEDAGRPVHVFGTGFRNGFNIETWNESAPYSPDAPEAGPTVFPIVLDESGLPADVSFAVDYANPADAAPFAVGVLEDTAPGELIPADTWMRFDIDVNDAAVLAYLQQGLAQGKLSFTFTSLNGGGHGLRTYPEFHTSDSLLGEAPRMHLAVRVVDGPPPAKQLAITGIRRTDAGIVIRFTHSGSVGVRWTTDFTDWTDVSAIAVEPIGDGSAEWTDSPANAAMKFYQLFVAP